jgi:small subunit ribosomal protein S6
MRRYETIYILRPNLSENEISTIIDNTTAILTSNGGAIIQLDKWGMRKLAYEIKKETLGYYVYCDYATNPAEGAEMERKFRIDDAVLKYMTIKLNDDISSDEVTTAISDIETRKAARSAALSNDDDDTADNDGDDDTETDSDDE